MSYSRWGGNDWYIFAHVNDAKDRHGQLLAIWHQGDEKLPCYPYAELKADREAVWGDICSRVRPTDRATFDECIDEFIEDEERREYPGPTAEEKQ